MIRPAAMALALLAGCASAPPPRTRAQVVWDAMQDTRATVQAQLDARFVRCSRHPALTAEQRLSVLNAWSDWQNGMRGRWGDPILPPLCENLLPPEHPAPVSVSVEDKPR